MTAPDRVPDPDRGRTRDRVLVRLRSTVAAGPLLIRRRIRRDGALLTMWIVTVSFAILLAILGPDHLVSTIDSGARETVEMAGSDTDLIIETPIADPSNTLAVAAVAPTDIADVVDDVGDRLPPALRGTLSAATVAVTGSRVILSPADVQPALDASLRVRMSLAMLTAENSAALELLNGELPASAPDAASADVAAPIDIALSAAAASATSLGIGSVVSLPAVDPATGLSTVLPARVVGVVGEQRTDTPSPRAPSPWRDAQEVWEPTVLLDRNSTSVGVTVLAAPDAVSRVIRARGIVFVGVIRYSFDAASFTGDVLAAATEESRRLTANSAPLVDGTGYEFDVTFDFANAVAAFAGQARAALAEMSIIVAGVIGTAGLVLLLVSRLIVYRRLPDVMLERARGASLVAIGLRTGIEAAGLVAVSFLIAIGVTGVVGIGVPPDSTPLRLVVAVALLVAVVQTVVGVLAQSTASAVGVHRRDAIRRRHRRRIARLTAEVVVLVAAAAAVVALIDRGLLQTESDGIDPLVASAPLLSAAAVTVLVLRVSRWPVRAAASVASRSQGIEGPVVASRLLRALAVVPLTALTIAIALVVGTGLIAASVRDGQVDASWQRVGADVRVDAPLDEDDIAQVASADGVSAASGLSVRNGLQLALGTSRSGVTVAAIDRGYARLVAGLPDIAGVTDAADAEQFARLSDVVDDAAPLPVIVDAVVADRLISEDVSIAIGDSDVPLRVVGVAGSGPVGYLDDPVIYVDLSSFSSRLSVPLVTNTLLAVGPGAAEAVERLEPAASDVLTRSGWLSERRALALVAGAQQAVVIGAAVLAALALAAIVCSALAGSPERARYLALLRTLGVRSRFGVLLAVIDQVPLMLASLIGGLLAGVSIAVLLAPALGLEFLTGAIGPPESSIPPSFLLQVLGGVTLVFSLGTLIEVLLRRRDRVSDAIRVGETV